MRKLYYFVSLLLVNFHLSGQLTPEEAGYLDAVTDFGADSTGSAVTTDALQLAINAATSQHKPLFIPPGKYLIDGTLVVEDDAAGDRSAQNTFITGSSVDPDKRSVLILKAGTFPEGGEAGFVIKQYGYGDEKYPDTFNRMLQSVDIVIESDNANASGIRWRGAEGVAIFDVHIDVTGGRYGMEMLPGSGGSAANISIRGGRIGIFLPNNSVQPTPTITDLMMQDQTECAILSDHTRGALTITGAKFYMNTGVPVFDLARHTGITWSPGGNPVLTDCVIEYGNTDQENLVFKMVDDRDQSVQFSNVFVKNAAKILDEDEEVFSNDNGWRHYEFFAYNSGWDENPGGDEPVYIDGIKQQGRVYSLYEDGIQPFANIQSRHSWGKTFPSFNSPGAINVKDFSDHVSGGDWAPAFNAAIEAAENSGSNVVFVPVGDYIIYNTIDMSAHTALVGAGHQNSRIIGNDVSSYRFGGAQDGWKDPKPMIRTPDDPFATCILADIGVNIHTPFNNDSHSPVAMACYALLWRAGNYSIIRNIDYKNYNTNYYRAAFVLTNNLVRSESMNLKNIDAPVELDGYIFDTKCSHAYHTGSVIPSQFLLETSLSDQRMMVKSLPPARMNAVKNFYQKSNMTIKKSGGGSFHLESLKLAKVLRASDEESVVSIIGYGASYYDTIIDLTQLSNTTERKLDLNWLELDSVVLLSDLQYSVDDVVLDGKEIKFEALGSSTFTAEEDYHHWCVGYGFRDLPMWLMNRPYITITGGCRYYNHWMHGSTWMRPTQPYLLIKDNDPADIVSIYHTHAQHSQNYYKIKAERAHNVSLFGIKTENSLEFTHADSCFNFRVFGHGGMTNPPRGVAHYRIENSRDIQIVSPTDEVVTSSDECLKCGLGDVMLPRTTFGYYDDIQLIDNGVLFKPDPTDSPILYKWGHPHDPWEPRCNDQYKVNLEGGMGWGDFCQGDRITIRADLPECGTFIKWTGDTQYLDDSLSSTTVINEMPSMDLSFQARFSTVQAFQLHVVNGFPSGTYCNQTAVSVTAGKPQEGYIFSHWSGDTDNISDSLSREPVVFIDGSDIFIEAVYEELVRPYGGEPVDLPGTIHAELFDKGGEGVAYHDIDSNRYDYFRTYEDVDIKAVGGLENDYYVDDIEPGEWLEYSVNSTTNRYEVDVKYGSGNTSGKMSLMLNGERITEDLSFQLSGGYDVFDTINYYPVTIPKGVQIVRVFAENDGFSLESIEFRELIEHPLIISIIGKGEVIPGEGTYRQGSELELLAVPAEGYSFEAWDGDLNSTENPLTLTINSELQLMAVFGTGDTTNIALYDSSGSVSVYPNPFSEGLLKIDTPLISSVRIMTIAGKLVIEKKEAEHFTFDRDEFNEGVYILHIENKEFSDVQRIVVL